MKEEEGSVENKSKVASYFTIVDVDSLTISTVINNVQQVPKKVFFPLKQQKSLFLKK